MIAAVDAAVLRLMGTKGERRGMAEKKPSYDTNRQKLRDAVPYNGPLSMYVEPTRVCNLKCFYCMHATRGTPGGALDKTGFRIAHMDMEMYDKLAREIMSFEPQPKRVCFSGLGEPLTNPELPEMALRLRKAGFTGRNDVITNGIALTPALCDALADSGINRVQISVQALTGEKYQKIAGARIDMEKYIENLTYLYRHKKDMDIFIKIIDANLESSKEEERFFEMFGSLCDTIFVEHLVIMEQQMGDHGGRVDTARNLNNEVVEKRLVCGVMFYFLQVNIDGDAYPCSTPGLPADFSMGNMRNQTLREIWDGDRRRDMIRTNLKDGYAKIPACALCSSCIAIADDTEYLDDCREAILSRFPKRA
jgi:radical SAM protein with 4Fe4S-binding SPASM domain